METSVATAQSVSRLIVHDRILSHQILIENAHRFECDARKYSHFMQQYPRTRV